MDIYFYNSFTRSKEKFESIKGYLGHYFNDCLKPAEKRAGEFAFFVNAAREADGPFLMGIPYGDLNDLQADARFLGKRLFFSLEKRIDGASDLATSQETNRYSLHLNLFS